MLDNLRTSLVGPVLHSIKQISKKLSQINRQSQRGVLCFKSADRKDSRHLRPDLVLILLESL
ncbi:MAG: hypothetical protein ACK55Z_26340, partial [bacterium]